MRIAVLGSLVVDGDHAALGPRDRVVLSALVLDPGAEVSAERLADALWSEQPPASWSKVVQGCVVRLRKTLGAEAVETTPRGYRLAVRADEIDVRRFERLLSRGRELSTLGEFERAWSTLNDALELWRGRPYLDLEEWEAAQLETARLEELRLDAEELGIEAAIRAGRHREVLGLAQKLVAEHPVRERRWELLARAEYQTGRQAEALRSLRRARAFLTSEVGIDPGPALVGLEDAILRQDASLDVDPVEAEPTTVCPYLGLVAYGIDDSESFFGREEIVEQCGRILSEQGVVAVVGPSGSGKSSVIRAGVAASLRRDGRSVTILTPGPRPRDTASAIRTQVKGVLIVDQCEEAVSGEDLDAAAELFDTIVEFAESGSVVLALRADRLGDVSRHREFARLLERGLLLLGAMNGGELRASIEGPAHQVGLLLEPGLVDLLVHEVEGEPGALPLLSHALRRTWERREGRVLTVGGYRQTGGLRGAVSQSAEELYGRIEPGQRSAVRDLMLRMVTPTPDGEPVRSPVPRRVIASDREHQRVIDLLVNARLVTIDGENVEIAHEALTRAWPRLRTWLDDDVEGQRILRHLTLGADTWDLMGRPDSELYRGVRLDAALQWRERSQADITPVEEAFLEAGLRLAERESLDAEQRARHQARVNRQLRFLLTGAVVLLVVALVAGFVALRSADRADREAATAKGAQGRALAAASLNVAEGDRSLALLLAVEAHRLEDSTETRHALLAALGGGPFTRTVIPTPAPDYIALALTPDGTTAVAKRAGGSIDIIDLRARAVRHEALPAPATPIEGVHIDPTGTLVVVSGTPVDGVAAVVYDLDSGEKVSEIPGVDGLYWARFSPDGDSLAVGSEFDATIDIYDLTDWQRERTIEIDTRSWISTIEIDGSGEHLVVGLYVEAPEPEAELVLIDMRTGGEIARTATNDFVISSIEPLPDGTIAAAGDRLQVYDGEDLRPVGPSFGPSEVGGLVSLAVSPDGLLVAGSPVDLQVHVGVGDDAESQTTLEFGAPGVAFVDGGATLVSADIEGTISTWTVGPVDDLGVPLEPAGPGLVTMSHDGSLLAVWGAGRGVQLFDRESLTHLGELDIGPEPSMLGVSFHPDGTRLATMACPRDVDPCPAEVTIWDVATRERLAGPVDVGDAWAFHVNGLVYTGDGATIATAGADGVVHLWADSTLEPLPEPLVLSDVATIPGEQVRNLAATRIVNRSLLAAVGDLGVTVVWDTTSGRPQPIGDLENAIRIAYAPDGRFLTSTGRGAFVLRDPLTLDAVSTQFPATTAPMSFSFTSDASVVVSSGGFGTEVWDVERAQPLSGVLAAVGSAISPDGQTLYLGAAGFEPIGREVRVLDLHPDELVADACSRAGRNLTESEWQTLLGSSEPYRATCPQWPIPPMSAS